MSTIKHRRGDVSLERSGTGANTQWTFVVEGQTSDAQQKLVLNNLKAVEDLKGLIGQVEHAAKVLNDE